MKNYKDYILAIVVSILLPFINENIWNYDGINFFINYIILFVVASIPCLLIAYVRNKL
jgi:uncharacterized membrane protein YqaE (UPF0057 family)